MKIFITGITGFVGGCAANYFAEKGHEITGIGRKDQLPPHVNPACKYRVCDISKPVPEIEADIVIHAGGLASDTATFSDLCTTNITGTSNVLKASKTVKHFIYISSSSVYNFSGMPVREEEAGLNPGALSGYGKTKLQAEAEVLSDRWGSKKTILRPRAVYGKYDQNLLPRLLKLVKGNRIVLPENLSKQISLTHIDNLVQVIDECIHLQHEPLAVYNVADKEVYDLKEVLTTLLPAVTGKELEPFIVPEKIFNALCRLNFALKLVPSFNRFSVSSIIQHSVLNTDAILLALNYHPAKNFYNAHADISSWVHHEEGWKYFFNRPPIQNPVI